MRIVVSHIPDAGKKVAVEGEWARAAVKRALDAEPTRVEGTLELAREEEPEREEEGRVTVTGHITVGANRVCERCGEDIALVVDTDVELVYIAMPTEAVAEEGEEEAEEDEDDDILVKEVDDGWYQNDALDLGDVLCEAIALALGPRVACADVEACDRRTAELLASKGTSGNPGHPAFARLKGLG